VLVTREDGRIEFANRAASLRLGEAAELSTLASLGASAAASLSEARPGARLILTLADGQRTLASIGAFVSAEGPRRLMHFVERYRRLAELPTPEKTRLAAASFHAGLDPLARGWVAERGGAYASDAEPPGLAFAADPDLLEQAVINVLKNALEAVVGRPDGQVRLSCRPAEGAVVIEVSDNGPGLARRLRQLPDLAAGLGRVRTLPKRPQPCRETVRPHPMVRQVGDGRTGSQLPGRLLIRRPGWPTNGRIVGEPSCQS
jgi:C4-dicarboxylate-specific signal transduction histidine kinase